MTSFYYQFLRELLELNFNDKTCEYYLTKNILDNKLMKIMTDLKEVNQLQSLLADTTDIPNPLFQTTLSHLKAQQDKIINFYKRWFQSKGFIGDHKAYKKPDVIIVLGANKTILKERTESAIKYAKTHSSAHIILSGGGFSSKKTESAYMFELIKKANLTNTISQEKVSMDTLGNALFTKLLLKKQNILIPKLKLLIITSQFHAPRALYYFNTIYKDSRKCELAVKGVRSVNKNLEKITLHELSSEYQSESNLGIFENNKKNPIDDTAILIKLFQHHALYKNRYDILREFLNIANKK